MCNVITVIVYNQFYRLTWVRNGVFNIGTFFVLYCIVLYFNLLNTKLSAKFCCGLIRSGSTVYSA